MLANLILAFRSRSQTMPMLLAGAAALLLAVTLAVFFTWTFPVNQATADWTAAPADWEGLRVRWEYSRAANAILTFLALLACVVASLGWSARPRLQPGP